MQVCSYINRPKFQYKDVCYKAPGTRQFLNYKCISSYYLIKVQVSMVKHVYEQKYSGNLQTDHFGKHVPEGKNGNSTRNQIHNGWQKYILNCNDLTYQPSNEYYNPIDEISFWPFHSSHIKIPSQTKYGYHQQIKKKIMTYRSSSLSARLPSQIDSGSCCLGDEDHVRVQLPFSTQHWIGYCY
jgi:hypothetical protein